MFKKLVLATMLLLGVNAFAVEQLNEADVKAKLVGSKGIIFIDAYAEWCGPCKAFSPLVEQAEKEFTQIKFYKLDIDKNPAFTAAFHIDSIPRTIILIDGKPSVIIPGAAQNYDQLKTVLEQVVDENSPLRLKLRQVREKTI